MHSKYAQKEGVQTASSRVGRVNQSKVLYFTYTSHRYAEVLENTQLTLITTIHKLYTLVRNGQRWELGEPELNDCGRPVVHNIAQKLGCIRSSSDNDLSVHSEFPEDEADMAKPARQLEDQWKERGPQNEVKDIDSSVYNRTEGASSSEIDRSNLEQTTVNRNAMALFPQSVTCCHDFDFAAPPTIDATALFPSQSPYCTKGCL